MSDWSLLTLGDVCKKVVTGGTPLSSNEDFYKDGTIPWLKTKEVNFCRIKITESRISKLGLVNSSAKLIPPNSVIIAMYGQGDTAGRVAINEIPLTTNQACCNLIIDERLADYNFIYFYLKNSYRELVNAKTGSAQPNLNTRIIKDFPIKLPALHEQQEIADVLTCLDRKIENLRRQNETLEQIAQTLFKHWFVDFEFPNAESQPYKSSGGEMVPSELGDIPAEWRVQELGNLSEVSTGKGIKNYEFNENGIYPVIGANGEMGRTDKYLKDGNLILTGRVGTLGVVKLSNSKVWISDNVIIISPTIESFYFIYFCLKGTNLKNLNRGSTQPLITQSDIKKILFSVPDDRGLLKFEALCVPIFRKIESNQGQIKNLTQIRDTLLPKLMSGQLRINE